ncbi:unnamed protein product [Amaranthus hypochondriacus]
MGKENELNKVKDIWGKWEIKILMLTSLFIQALLTFLAPIRKRSKNPILKISLWLLYLSADSIALLAIGVISRMHQNDQVHGSYADILAFWAPFLLLHLGGPDTITALALEDNELWLRHALQLATQVAVTLYVFGLVFRKGTHNHLWIPMILMFTNGCVKYFERTCALYYASKEAIRASLRKESSISFNKWADELRSAQTAHIPCRFEVKFGPESSLQSRQVIIDDIEENPESQVSKSSISSSSNNNMNEFEKVVIYAYQLYGNSRGLLADAMLNLIDDPDLAEFLLNKPVDVGLKLIETELNLFYDVLHTKVFLLQRKRGFVRIICFFSLISATFLFILTQSKLQNYDSVDVQISLVLLGGAIFLDIIAFISFVVSDWLIISKHNKMLKGTTKKFLNLVSSCVFKCLKLARLGPGGKRWSESTSSYNLLTRTFKISPIPLKRIFIQRIKDIYIDWMYVTTDVINKNYLEYIFNVLQQKAKTSINNEAIEQVCSARGNLVFDDKFCLVSKYLSPWTIDMDYDKSWLTWHLATDICYWMESADKIADIHCGLSKKLSDYMAYLLLRRQELVSELVGRSDIRFQHTIKEIEDYSYWKEDNVSTQMTLENLLRRFCEYVLYKKVDDEIQISIGETNDSQSVFHDACLLAKQLAMFGDDKWEIISNVWVEMLSYAAIHSSPRSHLAQLCIGGELITIVWLLMVQLGFRLPIPSMIRGRRSAKLIIEK